MFEFFIAKKYLIPKKRQLSLSLIALMSVGVISLVVWLVLIFLSVTEGIEKTWLTKLTSLNAPIRVVPTNSYYHSYYHKIDEISSSSNYKLKSLREKLSSETSDPYDKEIDEEIPVYFPEAEYTQAGALLDPVKEAFSCIEELKRDYKGVAQSDYEVAGALMKLRLIRPSSENFLTSREEKQSYLTQMSYVASFSENSPYLHQLLLPVAKEDVEHLLYLSSFSTENEELSLSNKDLIKKRLKNLLSHVNITKMQAKAHSFCIRSEFLKENESLQVTAFKKDGLYSHFLVPTKITKEFVKESKIDSKFLEYGKVVKEKGSLVYYPENKEIPFIVDDFNLYLDTPLEMESSLDDASFSDIRSLSQLPFNFKARLQNISIEGKAFLKDLEIVNLNIENQFAADPKLPPLWPYFSDSSCHLPYLDGKDHAAILPKNYKDAGVKIGDKGFLSYTVATANSMQEQRIPIFVSGFYDPGIMSVGARCILMNPEITHHIASASSSFLMDPLLSNGIQIWIKDLSKTKEVHAKLKELFKERKIDKYFDVTDFYEYEFAKDLMQQFQSDKYLFTLIGFIILLVACSNIISFLVIMVNDKKKEIGILQSMGASLKSVAFIFALCGATLGFLGSFIGTLAAYLTMKNIDGVANLLSMLQGHEAFHASFYGNSLPRTLSSEATRFILLTTPIISILAGLIPAIKACKVKPATTLRSE